MILFISFSKYKYYNHLSFYPVDFYESIMSTISLNAGIFNCQIHYLVYRIIIRETWFVSCDFSQRKVQVFDCVGCVNSSSDIFRVIKELSQVIPLFAEFFKSFMTAFSINCGIEFFQIPADSLKVFVRNKLCRITYHENNTVLDMSVWENCFYSIRKSSKPSMQAMRISSTPRFFMSVSTLMRLRSRIESR